MDGVKIVVAGLLLAPLPAFGGDAQFYPEGNAEAFVREAGRRMVAADEGRTVHTEEFAASQCLDHVAAALPSDALNEMALRTGAPVRLDAGQRAAFEECLLSHGYALGVELR